MLFSWGSKKIPAFRVSNFIATKQRGNISVIGKAVGRTSQHGIVAARSVKITLPRKYVVDFYQSGHRLIVVVNGVAVWIDNPSIMEGQREHGCQRSSQKVDSITEAGALCSTSTNTRDSPGDG